MPRKRAHISLETLLASELLRRKDAGGKPWIPYEHAKLMTAAQIISLFQRQHNILHSHDGPDTHWNVELMPIMQHREITAKVDIPRAAKAKKLARAKAALDTFLTTGEKPPLLGRPKKKIRSRGFPKGHRPLPRWGGGVFAR